eukprot:831013-Rhodomonas_salina.2
MSGHVFGGPPLKPILHGHVKDPMEFMHVVDNWSQSSVPSRHSSTSAQVMYGVKLPYCVHSGFAVAPSSSPSARKPRLHVSWYCSG